MGEQDADPTRAGRGGRSDRIITLDVLRGVAILGILLANVQIFRGGEFVRVLQGEATSARSALDQWVEIGTGLLITNTWLGAFSMLFGIGLAMQLSRPTGDSLGSARIVVLQRMLWLLLFGATHRYFSGTDVLLPYALAGLLVIAISGPVLPLPRWWVRLLGSAGAAAILLVPAFTTLPRINRSDELRTMLEVATPLQWLEVRAMEVMTWQASPYLILGWVLVGLWIGHSSILRLPAQRWRPMLLHGTAVVGLGLVLRSSIVLPGDGTTARWGPEGVVWLAAGAGSVLLTLGIALIVGACVAWWPERASESRLASLGRMALSAYLFQTLVCKLFFAVPGASAAFGPAGSLWLVAGVWLMLLLVCPWWLSRFRYGPVEWLWRTLTYRRLQPLRIRAEAPPRVLCPQT